MISIQGFRRRLRWYGFRLLPWYSPV